MLVGWYLRRAIPWMALLGCLGGALALVVALDRWPTTAIILLPALVAACAAAAAFTFDEVSLPVVEVTPRGAVWRRTARLAVSTAPLLLWTSTVLARPGDLPLSRGPWWLVGFAAIGLTAGLAALASRRSIASPGGSLASVVVLVVISPVVVTAFLGWDSLYPIGDFTSGVLTFWLAVAGAGALACVAALRPGVGA
jgi:hypothetical protein